MKLTRYNPDASHRYLTVTGRGEAARVDPYLYDTAARVVTTQDDGRFRAIVLVQTELGDDNAGYLADYQADRLRSGLYGVEVHRDFPVEALGALT